MRLAIFKTVIDFVEYEFQTWIHKGPKYYTANAFDSENWRVAGSWSNISEEDAILKLVKLLENDK